MSLPVAIAVIVLADLALVGILTFVMSRARLLTPHAAAFSEPEAPETRPAAPAAGRAREHTHAGTSPVPVGA